MSMCGDWAALGLLAEPHRRAAYEYASRRAAPVSRDDVATELGMSRTLAAFHLDKLAAGGLLAVSYARPPGRVGRGAGRPAKRYAPVERDVAVALPARRYDLLGRILARAISERPPGADPAALAARIAAEEGAAAGRARPRLRRRGPARTLDAAGAALADLGYAPAAADGWLRLRNCPFRATVGAAPDLVCGLNLAFVDGLLAGLGGDPRVGAVVQRRTGDCCVAVRALQ